MQLIIRGLSTHTLEVEDDAIIGQVKNRIAALENCKESDIILYAQGAPLNDDRFLTDFQEIDLELNVGLLGGKVHGSLSRAGKVKGQTPKVEKQEKKKKKTGRAKKRAQFNKRFVATVATFGRKRGPNSNSVL